MLMAGPEQSPAPVRPLLPLLDELRTIALNGLTYAQNPYDQERYARLLELASQEYGALVEMPPADVQARLRQEVGHVTPKVGADAAIFDEDGRILLMQRVDDGCWCLPCGWVEANESPVDAAVREVWEETGLHVAPLELVGVFTRPPDPRWGLFTMIAVCYLCAVTGGKLTLSHEGLALDYWRLEEVPAWHGTHERYAWAAFARWQARQKRAQAKADE